MSSVLSRSGIQIACGGVHIPDRLGWVVLPVPAYMNPLGELGRQMVIEACAKRSSILLDTFYLHGTCAHGETLEVRCEGRDLEDVHDDLRMHVSIPEAVVQGARPSLYLLIGHDETSILIGKRTEIEAMAHRSAAELLNEYRRYVIENWLGSVHDNMLQLLATAEGYNDSGGTRGVFLPL